MRALPWPARRTEPPRPRALRYFLEVVLAKDAVQVWSESRGTSRPTLNDKLMAIKEIIYPATSPATTQPVADATTQPSLRLEELVARQSGRTAGEQVEFIQHTFDAQMAQLDRREREVRDLERQVELAKQQMTRDRVAASILKLTSVSEAP